MEFNLRFYTEYHQFYLTDKGSPGVTDTDKFWAKDAYEDRLAIGEGILGVGTECYGHVKGELHVLELVNNQYDPVLYDHIVEADLEIKSGIFQVLSCTGSDIEVETEVPPGSYRARVYTSNIRSVEGDDGDDYYKIEIWPDPAKGRVILKRFINPSIPKM